MGLFKNFSLLWKNRKLIKIASGSADEVRRSFVKDGIATTEFWGKVVIQVLTVLAAVKPDAGIDPQQALIAISGLEALYHVGRIVIKAFAHKPAAVVPVAPAA